MQALLNVNLERNTKKLWRPWHRCDDMNRVLRSATDQEYKDILKDLILDKVALPKKIERKKRIILEKKQKNKKEQTGSWIKLEEPADKINLVEMGEKRRKGGKLIKRKGYNMFVGKIVDVVGYDKEHKPKLEDVMECNKPTTFRTRRIKGTYIRILHNLTFKKEDNDI